MNALSILGAWKETMLSKTKNPLDKMLDEKFTIEFLGKDGNVQNKADHLDWCTSNDSPLVENFNVIFEENGICVGTHTAKFPDEDGSDVMFYGKYENNKVLHWRVLRSVY